MSTTGQSREVAIRVLIVDDSAHFRAAAADLLTERGFELLPVAADADEALVIAARECPDGVLLDVNLPNTDGFTVAAALTTMCPHVKVVLTSATVALLPSELVRTSGATAFISKEALAGADLGALFRPEESLRLEDK
jgi:CheY-like chemotaxis protein